MLHTDGVILEYKNAVDETLTYKTVMNTIQKTEEADKPESVSHSRMEMILDQKVVKVKGKTADIDMRINDGSIERDGQYYELPSVGQIIHTTMEDNGKIISSSLNSGMNQPSFPRGLIRIGDTWTENHNIEVPLDNNQVKTIVLHYTYTLAELTHEKNYDVAVINITAPEVKTELQQGINQTIQVSGRTLFAHRAGRLVSSSISTKTIIEASGLTLNTDVTIDVTLQNVDSPVEETPEIEQNFLIGF